MRNMLQRILAQLRVRPRLLAAMAAGALAAWLLPENLVGATRSLAAWNIGVWLYLLLVVQYMLSADHGQLRANALSHADGALVVALLAVGAAAASLVAIFAVLHGRSDGLAWTQVSVSVLTLIGGWLLMTFEFALAYASRYYQHDAAGGGLAFPAPAAGAPPPHYTDFVYFALTIAATAQTSDVAVTTRTMRQLVLMQAALAFAFNTAVLALAINIVASAL